MLAAKRHARCPSPDSSRSPHRRPPDRSHAPAAPAGPRQAPVAISDTLFDHSEDVDFVLDPVTLHRGHAHTASRLPQGIRGEQAVITF